MEKRARARRSPPAPAEGRARARERRARAGGCACARRQPRAAWPFRERGGPLRWRSSRSRTFWAKRRDWRSRSSALIARRRCFSSARRLRLALLTATADAIFRAPLCSSPLPGRGRPAPSMPPDWDRVPRGQGEGPRSVGFRGKGPGEGVGFGPGEDPEEDPRSEGDPRREGQASGRPRGEGGGSVEGGCCPGSGLGAAAGRGLLRPPGRGASNHLALASRPACGPA